MRGRNGHGTHTCIHTHMHAHTHRHTPPPPHHHSCSSRFSNYLDTKQASHPSSNNAYLLLGGSHRSLGKEELGLFKQLFAWRLLRLLKSAVFKAQKQSGRIDTQSRDRKRNCWVWGHRVPAARDTWLFIFNGHFHPRASSKDVLLLNNWMHCGCARKEERGRGNWATVTSLEVNSGTTTPNLPLSLNYSMTLLLITKTIFDWETFLVMLAVRNKHEKLLHVQVFMGLEGWTHNPRVMEWASL